MKEHARSDPVGGVDDVAIVRGDVKGRGGNALQFRQQVIEEDPLTHIDMVRAGANADFAVGNGWAMDIYLSEGDKVEGNLWILWVDSMGESTNCGRQRRCVDFLETLREAFEDNRV